jgi:hypothetical protein
VSDFEFVTVGMPACIYTLFGSPLRPAVIHKTIQAYLTEMTSCTAAFTSRP